ncbi:ATP-binding protein [Streptomyces sp. NRRL WC-3742]|uniref:ATP-binding protein n=1 Tax=Streptomyces sp. NRRL WC-3742 TaxID=1463934 RepID=UPI00068E6041|nr:ATP-binding protein [Streptomyces sp. NRRL WC-3742]
MATTVLQLERVPAPMADAARHRRQMVCMVELTPQTARAFRDVGRLIGRMWRLPAPVEDAALVIVSEYVANAWQHSGTKEVALRLSASAAVLSLAVRDYGTWHPRADRPEWWHENGRGLAVVRRLAREAGGSAGCHHPASGGTIAWAHLGLAVRNTT